MLHIARHVIGTVLALAILAIPAILPAHAQSQDDPVIRSRQIRIGIALDGDRDRTVLRLQPFRQAIARATGFRAELFVFDTGQALVDATVAKRLDYAVLSASAYAMVYAFCRCVEPLAVPRAMDGTDGWHSVILVRADDPAKTVADVAGRTIATADKRSIGGWLVPMGQLAAEGVPVDSHFAQVIEMPDTTEAVEMLLKGEVDAAIAWSSLAGEERDGFTRGPLHDLVVQGRLDMTRLRIIWRSSKVPHAPHVVRAGLPTPIRSKLRDMLVTLNDLAPDTYDAIERTYGGGFVAAEPAEFRTLVDVLMPAAELRP